MCLPRRQPREDPGQREDRRRTAHRELGHLQGVRQRHRNKAGSHGQHGEAVLRRLVDVGRVGIANVSHRPGVLQNEQIGLLARELRFTFANSASFADPLHLMTKLDKSPQTNI